MRTKRATNCATAPRGPDRSGPSPRIAAANRSVTARAATRVRRPGTTRRTSIGTVSDVSASAATGTSSPQPSAASSRPEPQASQRRPDRTGHRRVGRRRRPGLRRRRAVSPAITAPAPQRSSTAGRSSVAGPAFAGGYHRRPPPASGGDPARDRARVAQAGTDHASLPRSASCRQIAEPLGDGRTSRGVAVSTPPAVAAYRTDSGDRLTSFVLAVRCGPTASTADLDAANAAADASRNRYGNTSTPLVDRYGERGGERQARRPRPPRRHRERSPRPRSVPSRTGPRSPPAGRPRGAGPAVDRPTGRSAGLPPVHRPMVGLQIVERRIVVVQVDHHPPPRWAARSARVEARVRTSPRRTSAALGADSRSVRATRRPLRHPARYSGRICRARRSRAIRRCRISALDAHLATQIDQVADQQQTAGGGPDPEHRGAQVRGRTTERQMTSVRAAPPRRRRLRYR